MGIQQSDKTLEVSPKAEEEFIVDTDFHAGPSSDMADLLPYIDEDIVKKNSI